MTDEGLKKKVRKVLKRGYFKNPDDLVDVSDGGDGNLHIVVVSRKFDGLRMKAKNDLIWAELQKNLSPEEWGRISLTIGTSPEEIKAT